MNQLKHHIAPKHWKQYFLMAMFNRIRQGDNPGKFKPYLKRWVKKAYDPLSYELNELVHLLTLPKP
jgi:hypothetical protein